MRKKNIMKISLSLTIALLFLLPTGAVMASGPKEDIDAGKTTGMEPIAIGMIDRNMNPVIDQATSTSIMEFILENPADEMNTIQDGDIIPIEEWYKPWFKLQTLEEGSHFEPELEIYKMNEEDWYCIYETSFEDNALNYMDWGQIDLDCTAEGGYYDGWTWSDARACGSDHSFKCTMYDEYKNMQDDVLYLKDLIDLTQDEFILCDGSVLDVEDISTVNVSFDTFVAGEGTVWFSSAGDDIYSPLDYLQFGYIDGVGNRESIEQYNAFANSAGYLINNDGDSYADSHIFFDTSLPLYDTESPGGPYLDYTPYARKIDGCPGWWHVWATIPVSSLYTPEEFGVFFEWRSDKERVFEGAYVDNVMIEILQATGEKIYQGHSQNWLDAEAGTSYFEFPLKWDDDIEKSINIVDGVDKNPVYYKAICKIKDDSGGYFDWKEIEFEIGDLIDCEITDLLIEDDFSHDPIVNGGIMQYPSDAHIKFTYHNNGNIPMENVAIQATGYKLEKQVLYEDDFEGMSDWVYFYDEAPIYTSDKFAWSGSKSLAFNNPETLHYDNDLFYVGYSQTFFDVENVKNAQMDMYLKYKLGDGEEVVLCMVGYQYVVGHVLLAVGGTETDWFGPMQPMGMYTSIDWLSEYNRLVPYGYFYDENGHQVYDVGIGMWLSTDDKDVFYNDESDWSGLYVDDISITALVEGDAVWSDTMVIPGPCEPCDTCTAQFTWEDVPYSCYNVVVEALCPEDVEDENDWMESSFCVMEDLEQMSKPEFVDYTECSPEAWCISNVVGNDCGNDGAGDHYALATNCDTTVYPIGVQDTVGIGPIDISHIELAGPPAGGATLTFDGEMQDMAGEGILTVYGSTNGGTSWNIITSFTDDIEFSDYFSANPAIDLPAGTNKVAFHYNDDGGWAWGAVIDNVDIGGTVYDFESGASGWTVVDGDGNLANWVLSSTNPYWTYGGGQSGQFFLIDDDGAGSGPGPSTDNWLISPDISTGGGGGSGACYTVLDESFEEVGWTWAFPPTGWGTDSYFYFNSLYGYANSGSQWAYSYSNDDSMNSPTVTFESGSTTLTFWYAAESSIYPQDLQVYVDGTDLVWSDYGFMHTSYIEATVDLSGYTGDHFVQFYNSGPTGTYGHLIDDVMIETCEPGAEPEGDDIFLNMTYQMDMRDPAVVILEVYGFEWVDGETCEGCSDPENLCADGIAAWEQVAEYTGNTPGICLTDSVNLADYLDENDTHFCLRFRLDTTDPSIVGASALPGIGMHIHELSISGILYDEIMDEQTDFYEDFEDANLVNEESGLEWIVDCVTFGQYWEEVDDFTFGQYTFGPSTEATQACGLGTLVFFDLYGDGWDGAELSMWIGGEQVVNDATITGNEQRFVDIPMTNGDTWEICVAAEETPWPDEVYFALYDPMGTFITSNYYGYCIPGCYTGTISTGPWPIPNAEPINNALIWDTEIEDAYYATFYGVWSYMIEGGTTLTLDMSADGGNTWYIIEQVDGYAAAVDEIIMFDLTPWAGSSLLFRVHVDNHGIDADHDGIIDQWNNGFVEVSNFQIVGKQDMLPPTATISLSGNNVGPGLYAGPVKVTINAVDESGMGEIHYILDGAESVVSGNKATFTVSTDGDHTVEYWAVDATGNEGAHGTVSFSIDNSPPTVALTAPEPGLYLFGKKLLGMSKAIIIGAFTAEATAADAQGVAVVKFMLNGEVIGEDTEAPFDTYVAVKNMGAATLKVVAEDGVGNTAEDSMDITYFKFL